MLIYLEYIMRAMAKKTTKTQKTETHDEITRSTKERSVRNFWIWMEKWSAAISLVVSPKTISLLILLVVLFRSTTLAVGEMRTYLEVFVMVVLSFLTAGFVQDWIDVRGNTVLEKKSTTSIRYLQALKYKIQNVAERIKLLNNKGDARFDEILNLIGNIDKDILNSISDWADINPASTAIVDYFEELRVDGEMIKQLKSDIEDQKEKMKSANTEAMGKLESEIAKKESKIYELQQKISQQSLNNFNIASGTYPSTYSGDTGVNSIFCRNCRRMLSPIDGYDANPLNNGLCNECKKKRLFDIYS